MKRTICLIGLLWSICSHAQQEDNWDTYIAQYDKGPGSTLLNMSLKTSAPNKEYPFILITGVTFKDCTTDGLPTDGAFNELYAVSDSVSNLIGNQVGNIMAGTFTYQCQREDYYYISDTTGIRKKLMALYQNRFPGYAFSIKIKPDPKWEHYLRFLYPNEITQEFMANSKVVMKLQEAGDQLDKERPVDYYLYFPSDKDRQAFIQYALKNNYQVAGKETIKKGPNRYELHLIGLNKVQVDTISKITLELKKQAHKYHGEYDGWESVIVKQ